MLVQQGNGFGSTEIDQIALLRGIVFMMVMIVFMTVITAIILILLLPIRAAYRIMPIR